MNIRQAQVADIEQIQVVRNAVLENRLSDPSLVPDSDVEDFITNRGKGWVCETDGNVCGFSIADLAANNVWALFVHPDYEKTGIGKKLHTVMMDWYFGKTKKKIWLSTAPGTRAEKFYRLQGWKETGIYGKGEIKFEMDFDTWVNTRRDKLDEKTGSL